MISLETKYMGLTLRNPIIVSSSGLTSSVDKIKKLEENGAGAIVLKSLFEEQINYDTGRLLQENDYPEAEDYIRSYNKSNTVDSYLELIEGAKKAVSIPVIASINCISASDWIDFAKRIEGAGADGLELNIYMMAKNKNTSSESYESLYSELSKKVKKKVKLPVSVKLGPNFTNLVRLVNKLEGVGLDSIVLFNRFYQPDIDIDKMKLTSAEVFSKPDDLRYLLRWVGIVSSYVKKIDISASTGIHDGKSVIKMLLAGATSVQVCSTLYQNGVEYLSNIVKDLESWMGNKGFDNIEAFRGKLNYGGIPDPSIYERAQFMKYFSNMH